MNYIVAVSGGVDSVVLLDMIMNRKNEEERKNFIVAHVDHGIRPESHEDEQFVRDLARHYDLPYESKRLQLGEKASENTARQARYDWLEQIRHAHHAEAIMTAHHQDDVIETMMINLIRGTGWRGVCSLKQTKTRQRPLLGLSRAEIIAYAIEHGLSWREDETNNDVRYLRNYIRYRYVQRLKADERRRWIELYTRQAEIAALIDQLLPEIAQAVGTHDTWSRYDIIMADEALSYEIMTYLLSTRLERQTLARLRHFICSARPGKRFSESGFCFRVSMNEVFVSPSSIC